MSSRKDLKDKQRKHLRRKRHIRRKVFGTAEQPRLVVFRSHKNIYCQIVDDRAGRTLAAASTRAKTVAERADGFLGNCKAASEVGKEIADKARAAGIEKVQFDRGGYRYHGRVKALADAAREGGLKF